MTLWTGKPVGSSPYLQACARSDAIRAARPWVRTVVDVTASGIGGRGVIPAGTVGRLAWRGYGCGDFADREFAEVIFAGFGHRTLDPATIEAADPHPGQLFAV